MNRRGFLKALGVAALCPVCTHLARASGAGPHWTYEGAEGPEHWGQLAENFGVCSTGGTQSPVDIVGMTPSPDLPPLAINYGKKIGEIVNNGHTIQVNMPPGSSVKAGAAEYQLLQFHFHRPSEHRLNGKSFPMEVHFVNRSAEGRLGVVGVLMTIGDANPAFDEIVRLMPREEGSVTMGIGGIDPNRLLPTQRSYFSYAGSLTTPPCSEGVDWMLLSTPISIVPANVNKFASLYPMNARPPQRMIKKAVAQSS